MAGWWYTYSSEKYKFVSWDYDIPNWKNKIHVPNHQPDGNILGYGENNHQQWGLHMYINVLCGCLQGI